MDADVLEIERMRLENEAVRRDLSAYKAKNATLEAALRCLLDDLGNFRQLNHDWTVPRGTIRPDR